MEYVNTVLASLNAGLHESFLEDECVYLLGEDILDPYGGAFKVTNGLSTSFPGRVLTTPVSEAGIVGVATGMALRGLRPIVEIMFGDFILLAADQLINQAAKFRWMYGGSTPEVRVPLVIRTPMGGRRGYGPTHSQTLEKLFLGIPGLRVLAPAALGNPGDLLCRAILETDDPVLFVENKLLYALRIEDQSDIADFILTNLPPEASPTYLLAVRGAPTPALTIAAYGYMADLARQAARCLAYEHEIFSEVVIPTQLAPFADGPILESARRTSRLLIVEESSGALGWSAEIAARATEHMVDVLQCVRRLAARDLPVPAAPTLEEIVLPGVADIVRTARIMVSSGSSEIHA
jgi:pyruvate/2-oxoglutarate/acetoin dehydrogenase E1 component